MTETNVRRTAALACPLCHCDLNASELEAACQRCKISFGRTGNVLSFICREMYESDAEFERAKPIIDFWGRGWEKRLAEGDHKFLFEWDAAGLRQYVEDAVKTHRTNRALTTQLDLPSISGKSALNIGCGAGEESLILSHFGAQCIGMDITSPAANAADQLIRRSGGSGFGIQADARFIPLQSESMDFVYSSGVLHHSPNITRSIEEIRRVLKPRGVAYVMLYATWSPMFMQERIGGFLKGKLTSRQQTEHMSKSTERAWIAEAGTNPYTQTFSAKQCRQMFRAFQRVRIRKGSFSVRQIRFVGRLLASVGLVEYLNQHLTVLESVLGPCIYIEAEK